MKVHYHQDWNPVPVTFEVLKKNEDGTVDIGHAGGEPVVTNCAITAEPVAGACTAVEDAPKDAPKIAPDSSSKTKKP